MILLIDNYDSFSYNLYQLIGSVREDIRVIRNDQMTIDEIRHEAPELIVLSPGPGRPEDAGIIVPLIKELKKEFPIFGVCLGLQAIVTAYGGTITYADELMHGKSSLIYYNEDTKLFKGLPNPFKAARYHSLAADKSTIPPSLIVTALTSKGEVMAVRAKDEKVFGLQFHPESIMTETGPEIISNLFKEI